MQRRFHTLVVLSLTVLAIVGIVSASVSPLPSPARAQDQTSLLTPPSFENQRGVIGVHPIPDPTQEDAPPIFAISDIPDPTAFPTTTVRVHNYEGLNDAQRFWLSVRIRQVDPGVDVVPEPGYAQMGLIAPGGDAEYIVTFPDSGSAQVEFEVDGSTDEAAMLTILQFALESGLTAANVTGLGDDSQELGLALAEVVSEQYLADLPTLTPCANAVAAVQRGLTDQEQFTGDVQGCLESPIWQTSVDEVLIRVAERDWFQQSLNAAGLAVPQLGLALKAVEATQFAARVWAMYSDFHPEVPGAMVGTVTFLSVDTTTQEILSAATAVPDLSVFEVVERSQAAVQTAGSYRYEIYSINESGARELFETGEVIIEGGRRLQDVFRGSTTYVDENGLIYYQNADGSWFTYLPTTGPDTEFMAEFLDAPESAWALLGTESTANGTAYVIERIADDIQETYWIEAATHLPLKLQLTIAQDEAAGGLEVVYSSFGASLDVQVPPEANENLDGREVGNRAIAAIRQAGSFRFQTYATRGGNDPIGTGEVNLGEEQMLYESDEPVDGYSGVFISGGNYTFITDEEFLPSGEPKSGQFPQSILATLEEFFLSDAMSGSVDIVSSEGTRWYVVSSEPSFSEHGSNEVWIDADTFMLGKYVSDDMGEFYGFSEVRFTDFGASVDIQAPVEPALPTSIPEPVTPLTSHEPTVIAEGLLNAIFTEDLARANQYFAPDRQRDSLADALGQGFESDAYALGLVAGCSGLEYTVVERQFQESGVLWTSVTFTFPQACATAFGFNMAHTPANQIRVNLESSTGRWYVEQVLVVWDGS